ncbi:HDL393Cp [Eremothecium sinecaudum]|uniref:HDL393Cp n=1 Tax=Eremothecium sinecaudum TaxID=45286 RepID=A0A0X8HQX9_9SACH|nr:HDL393Cp [Eremothecium sinecaudum]AMD20351.1 HDL393Cp [Eremothecium sinecaudum]
MSHQTPRVDPSRIGTSNYSVFRLIGKVTAQPSQDEITIQSPTSNGGMITLSSVRVSQLTKFKIDVWYEFLCRANDTGDAGFLVLDVLELPLTDGEQLSIDGVVALQNLTEKFPEMY